MPLSDVQLGGIAVPRNEVGFLCVAFAILSEDGEGLGNRACNVFDFRTSVIQVLKKLKSRDSNGRGNAFRIVTGNILNATCGFMDNLL